MDEIKNEIACTDEQCKEDAVNKQNTDETTVDCKCGCDGDIAETPEQREFVIDGERITDKQTLHAYIAGVMQLPDYYGSNLDALYDCLTEIAEPSVLKIINSDKLEEKVGKDYFDAFKQMLADATDENEYINVLFE